MFFANHLPKVSQDLLQTAWTSFDHSGSSSAGTALVESGNCKVSFILNRGSVTKPPPGARMVCSAFHSIKAVVSPVSHVGTLRTGSQVCGD